MLVILLSATAIVEGYNIDEYCFNNPECVAREKQSLIKIEELGVDPSPCDMAYDIAVILNDDFRMHTGPMTFYYECLIDKVPNR